MSQQHIYVESGSVVLNGNIVDITIRYAAEDATLTGLGLRIHYNSSALTLADISNLLTSDLIDGDATPNNDINDFDDNTVTDAYIDFAWASLFGNWPGSSPIDLLTATFDVAEGAESPVIDFSASSTAAGYELYAPQLDLSPPEPALVVTPNPTHLDENLEAGQVIGQAESGLPDATFSIVGASGTDEATTSGFEGDLTVMDQQVAITSVTQDDQLEMVVSYRSDDSTTTGLGLRVHYDSSVLALADVANMLTSDQIDGNATPADDSADFDGNTATDKYIDFAWASLFGQWPGSSEVDLFTMIFDVAVGAEGSTSIGFSTSSNAAGFTFDGQTYTLVFAEQGPVSIDANTGVITFNEAADFETQDEYGFTVVATGSDGSTAEISNVLHINNLDEVAPVITSGDTADAIDENSGAGQVI
jgi:hypothetical protein